MSQFSKSYKIFYKNLMSSFQNCQGHQNQEKPKKLPAAEESKET